ncbi:MAG: nitronate monooxygenase, partial [Acidobacteria bacterium]|nr:nitronate monooxygenase [Acidobacteriota bacterium]
GTRMVSSAESPVHDNWKQAIIDADETSTLVLNRHTSPALRALRTDLTTSLEFDQEQNAMSTLMGSHLDLYFGGDMEAAVALSGQVAGRIDEIRPVAEIIRECAEECLATMEAMADQYLS